MRWKLLFFFLLTFSLAVARHNIEIEVKAHGFVVTVEIPKVNYSDTRVGNLTRRDYYEFEDYSKSGEYKLPSFNFVFALPPSLEPHISEVNKEEIAYPKIVPAINPQLVRLNDSTIVKREFSSPQNFTAGNNVPDFEVESYFWYRDFYCVAIKINSHKFEPSTNTLTEIRKIKLDFEFPSGYSFAKHSPILVKSPFDNLLRDFFANSDIAEQFRSSRKPADFSDTTGAWINYNNTYLKISVAEDGIYRLTPTFFEKYGIDISKIAPSSFKLLESGKEIPLYVKEENGGTGFLEFYGHKNYGLHYRELNSDNEDYNEYLNKFTDTTYYFLTWNETNGKRVRVNNDYYNAVGDTLNYYLCFRHYEKNNWVQNLNSNETANQMPDWHKNKTWYWMWLGDWNSPRTFDFEVTDVVPGKEGKIYFKMTSGGSNVAANSHQVALYFKNTKLDSANVDRFRQVLLSGNFSSDVLSEGKNDFKVFNHKNGTLPNFLAVDWYDVEYPRYLRLLEDSLIFKVPTDISEGKRIIAVSGATSGNYVIYRIKPSPLKISGYVLENGNLFFSDSIVAGAEYAVFSEGKLLLPQYARKMQFHNLRSDKSQADYLAITHRKFVEGVNRYVDFIQSKFDVSTKIVNVQDIFDEFGYGYPTPRAVKNFLEFAFWNWTPPKFSYLELIGDASYDYKYIRYKNEGVKISVNYVPARGYPVGDNWYAVWKNSDPPVPQFKLGRLPVVSEDELDYFLTKIQNNENSKFDDWNKRYLFFSGGAKQSESAQVKAANDSIIFNYVKPRPIAGKYTHFYKTYNPPSSLGPYSQEEIQKAIDEGGIFISYLGHSGTATWDNGINSVKQLENKVDRYPLITDFGCSTNKYAEPDILSFGERFLFNSNGQAIAYNGNSSLGIFSTATTAPRFFYREILSDSLHEIGNASLYSKYELFARYGYGSANKVFALTNVVLGDPIVRLKIPVKPNINVRETGFIFPQNLSDNEDSVLARVVVNNFGLAPLDSFDVQISQYYNGEVVKKEGRRIILPEYADTLEFYFLTKNKPGSHLLKIETDTENEIDEIYEDDNSAEISVNVFSMDVRDMLPSQVNNGAEDHLILLLPPMGNKKSVTLLFETSDDNEFRNADKQFFTADSFFVNVPINPIAQGERKWLRYKLNESGKQFSKVKSFVGSAYKYVLTDSVGWTVLHADSFSFDNGIRLGRQSVTISVLSAGAYSGATCTISKNGRNLLGDTFFAGMSIVVFEPSTMEVDTAFGLELFQKPQNVQAMADFINSIEYGKIVAMGVSNDARNNMSSALRNAIKTLGSTKIDSLVFQGPWALIGWKGAPAGSVVEAVGGKYSPPIVIDSTFVVGYQRGSFLTEAIGPASRWNTLKTVFGQPSHSRLEMELIGIRVDGTRDTLGDVDLTGELVRLDTVSASEYPYLQALIEFSAGDSGTSPVLNFFGVDYENAPELGINYQTVSLSADTVMQNENITLRFSVFNVGGDLNDSCSIKAVLIKPDKSEKALLDTSVTSIRSTEHEDFKVNYLTNFVDGYGEFKFKIVVDAENKIPEFFEDNNVFEQPFYVAKDTITILNSARFDVTFDGERIFDGDYVSSRPNIVFRMNYTFGFDYNDTSAFQISIDNVKVPHSALAIQSFDTAKKEIVMKYKPSLQNGEHFIRITGENIFNAEDNSQGYSKYFYVTDKLELRDIYNYPNPFSDKTYFTFRLTKIPDAVDIKIYTVAGRLIKTIEVVPSELNLNFNKICWDGTDEDGDAVANGTYLYRLSVRAGDEKLSSVNKIVRLR